MKKAGGFKNKKVEGSIIEKSTNWNSKFLIYTFTKAFKNKR